MPPRQEQNLNQNLQRLDPLGLTCRAVPRLIVSCAPFRGHTQSRLTAFLSAADGEDPEHHQQEAQHLERDRGGSKQPPNEQRRQGQVGHWTETQIHRRPISNLAPHLTSPASQTLPSLPSPNATVVQSLPCCSQAWAEAARPWARPCPYKYRLRLPPRCSGCAQPPPPTSS